MSDVLSGGSLRRRAVLSCLDLAGELAGATGEGLSGEEPAEALLAGLGVAASGTECARDWQAADDDALRRYGTTATWSDDVARLTLEADSLAAANRSFRLWNRIGRAALVLK